jgi:hypothetical protein
MRAKRLSATIRFAAAALVLGVFSAARGSAECPPPYPVGGREPVQCDRDHQRRPQFLRHRVAEAGLSRRAVSTWGLPNGYVLGEEAGGAFVAGLRYGEGMLYTKNAGDLKVYWQGPSIGWDVGGEGARTMMLIYNLPNTGAIYERFGGIDGSAYFIGGFGMTALTNNSIVLVPIRSGVGLRLGANISESSPKATGTASIGRFESSASHYVNAGNLERHAAMAWLRFGIIPGRRPRP